VDANHISRLIRVRVPKNLVSRSDLPFLTAKRAEVNKVDILEAKLKLSGLQLGLTEEDAIRVASEKTFFIGAQRRFAEPLDVSFDYHQCYNCWLEDHNGNDSVCLFRDNPKCGKCAEDHLTEHCTLKPGEPNKCWLCKGSHKAYGKECEVERIVEMKKRCNARKEAGPYWWKKHQAKLKADIRRAKYQLDIDGFAQQKWQGSYGPRKEFEKSSHCSQAGMVGESNHMSANLMAAPKAKAKKPGWPKKAPVAPNKRAFHATTIRSSQFSQFSGHSCTPSSSQSSHFLSPGFSLSPLVTTKLQ
jgi:hypothetical protein